MNYPALKSHRNSLPALLLAVACVAVFSVTGCGNGRSSTKAAKYIPAATPQAAVTGFLNWRINSQITGTPDAEQLEAMAPYISAELHGLLQKAREEYEGIRPSPLALSRERESRLKPDQRMPSPLALSRGRERGSRLKPSLKERKRLLGESDLFSSMFEGPTSFSMGDVETQGDEHVVPVRFMSGRQLPAINWIDRVRVVQENGHYVVADVEYANHWSLGNHATLLGVLQGATARRDKRRS